MAKKRKARHYPERTRRSKKPVRKRKSKKALFLILFFSVLVIGTVIVLNRNHITINRLPTNDNLRITSSVNDSSNAIIANSQIKNMTIEKYNKHCDWKLYLVNADYPLPKTYKVKTKGGFGYPVDVRIYDKLKELIDTATSDGVDIFVGSAYRTLAYQQELFNCELLSYMQDGLSKKQAYNKVTKSILPPGASEHQLGLAIDFVTESGGHVNENFKETPTYKWLKKHATDYGFIERYIKGKSNITKVIFEPWHYRYVGVENARKIKKSGLCLEEYIEQILMPRLQKKLNKLNKKK